MEDGPSVNKYFVSEHSLTLMLQTTLTPCANDSSLPICVDGCMRMEDEMRMGDEMREGWRMKAAPLIRETKNLNIRIDGTERKKTKIYFTQTCFKKFG